MQNLGNKFDWKISTKENGVEISPVIIKYVPIVSTEKFQHYKQINFDMVNTLIEMSPALCKT